jgi:acetylornithine deacetylase
MDLDPISLAARLIDIPSPSGHEAEVARALVPVLEEAGLRVSLQPVAGDRVNVLAEAGGGEPEVVLCTHLDVVPPHIPARREGEWLYGRGACDTKGILAAMVAAAAELTAAGTDGFALLLVVAEETDSIGARAADGWRDWRSRWVVVGEPTGSRFARGQKGALKAELTAAGRAAHSAYPERGEDALTKLLPVLADLQALDWGEDPMLGRGTLNIGELHAGVAANIVPPSARAALMVRVVDSLADCRQRLEQAVAGRAEIVPGLANEPQRLFVPEGRPETVVAFNTDVAFLPRLGRPLLYGPGSILDAHGDGERIRVDDIRAAVAVYRDLVRELRATA